jgi:predicted nucleic-acid-binding protein
LIGIDTNVLVRYLTQDDPAQSSIANKFFQQILSASQQGFISLVVLVETCWVLQSSYTVSDVELSSLIENLLQTPQLSIENRDCLNQALQAMMGTKSPKVGFVDFLIHSIAETQGCHYCVTFDKRASQSVGMRMLTPAALKL